MQKNTTENIVVSNGTNLIDNFGRNVNYLRLAVTDRCNLRCTYCMPAEGIPSISHNQILRFEESLRLIKIFIQLGVKKLRLTGGEPFVRKGFTDFLKKVSKVDGLSSIHLTTNGVLTTPFIPLLEEIGIAGINISIDTLNRDKFIKITRRDEFEKVEETLNNLLESEIKLKINTVVLPGVNDDEIISIAKIAKDHPIEVRFIEQMPFDGNSNFVESWKAKDIVAELKKEFELIPFINENESTANLFTIPGFKGKIGIIGGYSRLFCDTCNRVRVTTTGMMKTCLYDNGVLNLKDMLRNNFTDEEIKQEIVSSINKRYKDGYEAEAATKEINKQSMASIGG